MLTHTEKRYAPRRQFEEEVTFEQSAMSSDDAERVLKVGTGVDISPTGLGLLTDHQLTSGDVLMVHLAVLTTELTMPVYSEIVWTKFRKGRCRAGLRFLA